MTMNYGVEDLDPCRSAVRISGRNKNAPSLLRALDFLSSADLYSHVVVNAALSALDGLTSESGMETSVSASGHSHINPPAGFPARGFCILGCYFHSSIRIPRPGRKSVTNQVVWIAPPATITFTAPGFRKGLISVLGEALNHVAKGSIP